ncbi:MAG: type III polyketide synthase [Alphaproteobacteria bacterium]|nr:type III polyketide synthase [Alphaproteobacteria bacterium]MBU1516686.1 type III polyketide synthase [Alphaproteobacteria bacterium]MBU2094442.1 type III polyketide synthase [Alphaproteobacteria bacterium]MBU2152669.1 type III polyketide synthase [Alphaproteobacteria bacterium]MBU2306161.1 type III polyketide synthase [Alphaproteobacteria bacterium]
MISPVALLSLATASPRFTLAQKDVEQVARDLFSERFPQFERMAPVFTTAGVRTRQVVRPIEWYLQPRGWPERTEVYLEAAVDLFAEAAGKALDEAGLKGSDVDVIVTVSSTGIATPSLEARAMARMGFRPDAARIPVFGLGCAGGATGLGLAGKLAAATPGAVVLMVAVELCSMAFRMDELTKADIVATALFGDGAAACVLRAGEGGLATLTHAAERTWPDTLDIMGWRIDPTGLGVIFARSIPPFARDNLRPAMESMLQGQGLEIGDVDRFICHPGGVKVIEALEQSLSIGQGQLDHERAVLADHGNMSAPTVLFVLDRARRSGLPETSVVSALGPGFTASTATLRRAA